MSETNIHAFAAAILPHPNVLAIARLLARQAATAKYLPSPTSFDWTRNITTNDNENADEAGSNLRAIQ
jgi:hypothetical protein